MLSYSLFIDLSGEVQTRIHVTWSHLPNENVMSIV